MIRLCVGRSAPGESSEGSLCLVRAEEDGLYRENVLSVVSELLADLGGPVPGPRQSGRAILSPQLDEGGVQRQKLEKGPIHLRGFGARDESSDRRE